MTGTQPEHTLGGKFNQIEKNKFHLAHRTGAGVAFCFAAPSIHQQLLHPFHSISRGYALAPVIHVAEQRKWLEDTDQAWQQQQHTPAAAECYSSVAPARWSPCCCSTGCCWAKRQLTSASAAAAAEQPQHTHMHCATAGAAASIQQQPQAADCPHQAQQ